MRSIGDIIEPQKITTASLRGLWVPNWETGQVANAGCSQLTDWSGNGFHLTQATGSLQPLFKQDTSYRGKWYIKFDGVDDVLTNVSNPLSTNNGQLLIIFKPTNRLNGIFGTSKLTCGMSTGTIIRVNSSQASPVLGLAVGIGGGTGSIDAGILVTGCTGYTNQAACAIVRKTGSGNYINVNNSGSLTWSLGGVGDPLEASGISLGKTVIASGYYNSEIACIALWEGTDLTANDISGLFNWSRTEFEVYRDLLRNKI